MNHNNSNNQSINYKNGFSIPLITIIIPLIIVVIITAFSFNIYAKNNDSVKDEEQMSWVGNVPSIENTLTQNENNISSNNTEIEEKQDSIEKNSRKLQCKRTFIYYQKWRNI